MNQSKKNKFYSKGKNKYTNQPFQGGKKKEENEVETMTTSTDNIGGTKPNDRDHGFDFGGFSDYFSKSLLSAYSMPRSTNKNGICKARA